MMYGVPLDEPTPMIAIIGMFQRAKSGMEDVVQCLLVLLAGGATENHDHNISSGG